MHVIHLFLADVHDFWILLCILFFTIMVTACLISNRNLQLLDVIIVTVVVFVAYLPLKLQLRVFLADHTVAMISYSVTKMITTCSPMVGQFFDTMIAVSSDKSVFITTHRK